jgi:hypothetical protein
MAEPTADQIRYAAEVMMRRDEQSQKTLDAIRDDFNQWARDDTPKSVRQRWGLKTRAKHDAETIQALMAEANRLKGLLAERGPKLEQTVVSVGSELDASSNLWPIAPCTSCGHPAVEGYWCVRCGKKPG